MNKRFIRIVHRFFIKNTLAAFVTLFIFGAVLIDGYLTHISDLQIKNAAIDSAKIYANMLNEFRAVYISEVVHSAQASGMKVTHDYKDNPNTIPLPVTLSMFLMKGLHIKEGDVQSKLYSLYPFPWRKNEGGMIDTFAHNAWTFLKENPEDFYVEFDSLNSKNTLHFAIAENMTADCISCHNTHPDSPKTDWKPGDVGGVLEIIIPMDHALSHNNEMIEHTMQLLILILTLSFMGVWYAIYRLRLSAEYSRNVSAKTRILNRQLQYEIQTRQQAEHKLLALSQTDYLTGVANRRKFDEVYELEWHRAIRANKSITLIMIDLDAFKAFNDNYGHPEGDLVLKELAQTIRENIPWITDFFARIGGEEFIIILPDTERDYGEIVANVLLKDLESKKITHAFSPVAQYVTFSAGVVSHSPTKWDDRIQLLKKADVALYQAKSAGRNQVLSN